MGDIAKQMHVSSQFVAAEISKLIRRSVVEKRPNEADRRSVFLNLTPLGCRFIFGGVEAGLGGRQAITAHTSQ